VFYYWEKRELKNMESKACVVKVVLKNLYFVEECHLGGGIEENNSHISCSGSIDAYFSDNKSEPDDIKAISSVGIIIRKNTKGGQNGEIKRVQQGFFSILKMSLFVEEIIFNKIKDTAYDSLNKNIVLNILVPNASRNSNDIICLDDNTKLCIDTALFTQITGNDDSTDEIDNEVSFVEESIGEINSKQNTLIDESESISRVVDEIRNSHISEDVLTDIVSIISQRIDKLENRNIHHFFWAISGAVLGSLLTMVFS
jgi:hypothetical protein